MKRIAIIITLAASLVGCAGGGTPAVLPHASPSPTSAKKPIPAGTALTFAVPLPRSASSSARKPQYISSATQSLQILVATSTAGPAVGSPTIINVATCPVQGGYAMCEYTVPTNANNPVSSTTAGLTGYFVQANAWSGANATGQILSTTQADWSPFAECNTPWVSPGAAQSVVCVLPLAGITNAITLTQAHALVLGTASTTTLSPTFKDAAGNTISSPLTVPMGDTAIAESCVNQPDRYGGNSYWEAAFSVAYSDPHLAATNADTSAGCAVGGSLEGDGTSALNLNSAAALYTLAFDGASTAPAPISFDEELPYCPPCANVGPVFQPITVPANPVAFASGSSPAQSVTITPPVGYTGSVSLVIDSCYTQSLTVALPATSQTTNAAASPLLTVSPASASSTNGSPVTFSLSATGTAGACTYHASTDPATEYGATIGM